MHFNVWQFPAVPPFCTYIEKKVKKLSINAVLKNYHNKSVRNSGSLSS